MASVPKAEMHDDISRLVLAGIEKFRAKLLDLSLGNRLINFKHSERSRTHIRVIDETPEILFDRLEQGRKPIFAWIEEPELNLSDEQTPEFRAALAQAKENDAVYLEQKRALGRRSSSRQLHRIERELRDRIRQQFNLPPRTEGTIAERAKELGINPNYDLPHLTDQSSQQRPSSKIQTLHYREQMESKLSAIRDSDRTLLQDAGIAALYCAFGFVEWYETADSETSLYAPLLLYPVEIQRELQGGRYTYTLEFRDEDIEPNITLAELFRTNFGLELPAWDPDSNLTDYFAKLERLISERRKWRLRRWATVGLFTFAKLIEFQDLDPRNWRPNTPLEKHTVLQDLLAGTESVAEAPLAPEYPIDSPSIAKKGLLLVTDADSSQHSAVIDVLDGKNLVIQGPPGTGKSQTITNIIAAALGAAKTVLFIAEKMAALEVVKSRLDHFGLGHFCLEIHSSKTRKTSVLQSLKERLEFSGPQFDLNQLEQAEVAAEQARNDLLYYVDRMKQHFGRTGLTIQEVLRGNIVRAEQIHEFVPWLKRIRINQVGELDRFIVEEVRDLAYELEKQVLNVNLWDGLIHHPWRGFQNDQLDAFRFDDLTEAFRSWSESAQALRNAIDDAVAITKWPIVVSVRGAKIMQQE